MQSEILTVRIFLGPVHIEKIIDQFAVRQVPDHHPVVSQTPGSYISHSRNYNNVARRQSFGWSTIENFSWSERHERSVSERKVIGMDGTYRIA